MPGLPLLDQLMANAWRPVEEEVRDGWRFRFAHGVTRRANSALAVEGDGSTAELVDHGEAFYRERQAPARFLVSTASAPSELARHLRERGYRPSARTLVAETSADDLLERTEPAFEVDIDDAPSDEWFGTYWAVEATRSRSDADAEVVPHVLLEPGPPTVFVTVRDGAEPVGVGQAVIERSWAGVQCMATAPSHRRRGVAGAALNALARAVAPGGANRLYLAVMADNEAALNLYERAGFTTAHEYSYFTKPD